MTCFNTKNTGHITGNYPLLLGDSLGVVDTVNTPYPELEELYQLQLSQLWNEFEVDLRQDKLDMQSADPSIIELMQKTIMWQHSADSVASRSIIEVLGPYITNTELHNLATLWSFFEVIHARTYSHIIKQTFVNPVQGLEEIYEDEKILDRSGVIVKCFDDLRDLPRDTPVEILRERIVCAVLALFALESTSFMASFAVTFGVAETGVFQGIGSLVKLVCRDEVLHTRMDYTIIDILKKDADFGPVIKKLVEEGAAKALMDAVVQQELDWTDYLFSDGRSVVGLNDELLKEYIYFMSSPVYKYLGISPDFEIPKSNPLPYTLKYIDPTKMQVAAQELQVTSYKVGAIEDDTDGLDLDF